MNDLFIPLVLTPGTEGVYIRSLCGADELAIEDLNTANLINFLNSLMKKSTDGNTINASQIVTADRDRLLAALYISTYGSKVECTLTCQNCEQKFDMDFSLIDLLKHYQPLSIPTSESGIYEIEPGICFRLPNGEDEILINGSTKHDAEKLLLERCLQKGNPETDKEKVQLKMEELAPVLNLIMQAICPECSHSHQAQFDIQSFFLLKLLHGKQLLIQEIHCIASQYHWSHQEILNLPRSLRKQYVALIQSEN